ncbi:MAG: hypothetical protein M9911_01070 [Saprospiraceae bacterium]|nr:hypothetical protein [Saprospiraceae bacterium]
MKKFRQKYQLFTVEGDKSVSDLLSSAPEMIKDIVLCDDRPDWLHLAKSQNILIADKGQMNKISSMSTPPGIMVICYVERYLQKEFSISPYSIYLDNVRDAGNIGTIIRAAEWFGIRQVYLSSGSVDLFHPKLIQATMGSFFRINIKEIDTSNLEQLTKPWIGADMAGQPLQQYVPPGNGTIILGNESLGISEDIRNRLEHRIMIQADSTSHAESLNVSTAASIFMYHCTKSF